MVLFNEKEQIKKYTVEDIINDFCKMRYGLYTKRKNHIVASIEKDLKTAGNKERFITEIIEKKLNIMNVEESKVVSELEKRGYNKDTKETDDEDEKESSKHGYEYLLRLQVRTLTADKVKQLKDDILALQKKLEEIKATTEKQMWLKDLGEFEVEYQKWLKTMETQKPKVTKKQKK
jgi:DNA topoisomerase-2